MLLRFGKRWLEKSNLIDPRALLGNSRYQVKVWLFSAELELLGFHFIFGQLTGEFQKRSVFKFNYLKKRLFIVDIKNVKHFRFLIFSFVFVLLGGAWAGFSANAGAKTPDPCELAFIKISLRSKKIEEGILVLPKKIALSVKRGDADHYFQIGAAIWKEEWKAEDIQRLGKIASKSLAGEFLTSEDIKFVTDRRASLKEIRFLFKALSADHNIPDQVDELGIALGKLRDRSIEYHNARLAADSGSAIEGASLQDRLGAVKVAAQRFQKAITKKKMAQIEAVISKFDPVKKANFDKWLNKAVEDSIKIAKKGNGSPQEFHELRKNMQAMLSIVRFKLNAEPESVEWKNIYQAFVNVTEKLGNMVGEYEAEELKGQINFKYSEVRYSADLMRDAIDLLERVKKGL